MHVYIITINYHKFIALIALFFLASSGFTADVSGDNHPHKLYEKFPKQLRSPKIKKMPADDFLRYVKAMNQGLNFTAKINEYASSTHASLEGKQHEVAVDKTSREILRLLSEKDILIDDPSAKDWPMEGVNMYRAYLVYRNSRLNWWTNSRFDHTGENIRDFLSADFDEEFGVYRSKIPNELRSRVGQYLVNANVKQIESEILRGEHGQDEKIQIESSFGLDRRMNLLTLSASRVFDSELEPYSAASQMIQNMKMVKQSASACIPEHQTRNGVDEKRQHGVKFGLPDALRAAVDPNNMTGYASTAWLSMHDSDYKRIRAEEMRYLAAGAKSWLEQTEDPINELIISVSREVDLAYSVLIDYQDDEQRTRDTRVLRSQFRAYVRKRFPGTVLFDYDSSSLDLDDYITSYIDWSQASATAVLMNKRVVYLSAHFSRNITPEIERQEQEIGKYHRLVAYRPVDILLSVDEAISDISREMSVDLLGKSKSQYTTDEYVQFALSILSTHITSISRGDIDKIRYAHSRLSAFEPIATRLRLSLAPHLIGVMSGDLREGYFNEQE